MVLQAMRIFRRSTHLCPQCFSVVCCEQQRSMGIVCASTVASYTKDAHSLEGLLSEVQSILLYQLIQQARGNVLVLFCTPYDRVYSFNLTMN